LKDHLGKVQHDDENHHSHTHCGRYRHHDDLPNRQIAADRKNGRKEGRKDRQTKQSRNIMMEWVGR
jgi:hypothetical protein